MQCNVEWDRNFQYKNFPKKFVNETYKNYRAKMLVDEQKALLPQDMEKAKRAKELKDFEIKFKEFAAKRRSLKKEIIERNKGVSKNKLKKIIKEDKDYIEILEKIKTL